MNNKKKMILKEPGNGRLEGFSFDGKQENVILEGKMQKKYGLIKMR